MLVSTAPTVADGDAVLPVDPLVLTDPAQAAMKKIIDSVRDFWRNERRLTSFLENICCCSIFSPQPLSSRLVMLIQSAFRRSFPARRSRSLLHRLPDETWHPALVEVSG